MKTPRNGQDSGSFAKYLLFDNKIDADTLIDIRIVCVDLEHSFGTHRDTGNHKVTKFLLNFM